MSYIATICHILLDVADEEIDRHRWSDHVASSGNLFDHLSDFSVPTKVILNSVTFTL